MNKKQVDETNERETQKRVKQIKRIKILQLYEIFNFIFMLYSLLSDFAIEISNREVLILNMKNNGKRKMQLLPNVHSSS